MSSAFSSLGQDNISFCDIMNVNMKWSGWFWTSDWFLVGWNLEMVLLEF